jgi:hypothetical protein
MNYAQKLSRYVANTTRLEGVAMRVSKDTLEAELVRDQLLLRITPLAADEGYNVRLRLVNLEKDFGHREPGTEIATRIAGRVSGRDIDADRNRWIEIVERAIGILRGSLPEDASDAEIAFGTAGYAKDEVGLEEGEDLDGLHTFWYVSGTDQPIGDAEDTPHKAWLHAYNTAKGIYLPCVVCGTSVCLEKGVCKECFLAGLS